jgi:hypothetical protein
MDVKEFFSEYKPKGKLHSRPRIKVIDYMPFKKEELSGFSVFYNGELVYNKKCGTSLWEIIHDMRAANVTGSFILTKFTLDDRVQLKINI